MGYIPAREYKRGPRGNWLAHYCGHCGLRLLVFTRSRHTWPLDTAQLAETQAKQPGVKIAPSPFLQDERLLEKLDFENWKDRYCQLRPARALHIGLEEQTFFPREFRDLSTGERVFAVEYPDMDEEKFDIDFLFPSRYDRRKAVPTVWDPTNATIRIVKGTSGDTEQETGLVQIAQMSWDLMLYFPQGEAPYSVTGIAGGNGAKGVGRYDCRTLCAMPGGEDFEISCPHFLWKSSKGQLLWTARPAMEGTEGTHGRRRTQYVLLDGYDRLVAMETGGSRARRCAGPDRRLLFYEDFPESFIGEIVTSYLAFRVQMFRRWDWENAQTSTSDRAGAEP